MKRILTCPECGRVFETEDHRRKYCSPKCRRKAGRYKEIDHEEKDGVPVLREFTCKNCGRLVRVTERSDRRSSFCSVVCEREARHGVYRYPSGGHVVKKRDPVARRCRDSGYMSDAELERFLRMK